MKKEDFEKAVGSLQGALGVLPGEPILSSPIKLEVPIVRGDLTEARPTLKDAKRDSGFGNFCLVIAAVNQLEWLHLAAAGHQRAAFNWSGEGPPSARWLAP